MERAQWFTIQRNHSLRSGWRFVTSRMKGPGGYYNMGNALGLVSGVLLQVYVTQVTSMLSYFTGSVSATALTVSMLLFFWSGEQYHRAWSVQSAPHPELNRSGDLYSAYGALALGVGLLFLGHPVLAATAGLLHAVGKYGSAMDWSGPRTLWPEHWANFWRLLVPISRLPALAALGIELNSLLRSGATSGYIDFASPVALLICYFLWAYADVLLMRPSNDSCE